jgi:hypothetical protein
MANNAQLMPRPNLFAIRHLRPHATFPIFLKSIRANRLSPAVDPRRINSARVGTVRAFPFSISTTRLFNA